MKKNERLLDNLFHNKRSGAKRSLWSVGLWLFSLIFLLQACAVKEQVTPPPVMDTAINNGPTPNPGAYPSVTPIPSITSTNFSAQTPSPIVWQTNFESGDLRDFQTVGDFINQGSGSYAMVNSPAHSGKYAAALTINTANYSPTGGHAAYLFYWKDLPDREYYYSAWYYIPAAVVPQDWWTIWQWKSTYNGNSDDSEKVFSIGISEQGGLLFPYMSHRLPGRDTQHYYEYKKIVPVDQWFQIEAYYRKSNDSDGQVVVWLDGEEIFNFDHVQTTLTDNTIDWSVNNYAEKIVPNSYTIYVDDIAISHERITP